MKQCPFCGAQWNGKGSCPNCGVNPETSQDDSQFRPPESGSDTLQETPPEFDVEKILRWEPSPQPEEPGEDNPEQEEDGLPEEQVESDLPPRKRFKPWQKFTAAAVAVAVVATAAAIKLWPQPQALPEESAFFVQDNILMALSAGGEPRKVAPYTEAMSYDMFTSPDQKSVAWLNRADFRFYLKPYEGEVVTLPENNYAAYPVFSKDSQYLYYSLLGDNGEETLYRYEIESGKEQAIGQGSSNYLWEDGSLLAVGGSESFAIYDSATLEQKWSVQASAMAVGCFGGAVYYVEETERYAAHQLCRWKDGKTEVLLENVTQSLPMKDGSVYLLCRIGEEVPVSDLVENDMGTKGENIMEELQGENLQLPQTSLYCLKDDKLIPLGDDLSLHYFGEKTQATLVSAVQYQSVEGIKFSLNEIVAAYGNNSDVGCSDVINYINFHLPKESSVKYLAKDGKLYSLPENVPQSPYILQTAGDWMCFYHYTDVDAERGLWLGHIEGDKVVFQKFFLVSDINSFLLTPQGKVYYWSGNGNQFMGVLYENGVPLLTNINLQNVQTTEDGAAYFLNGSSSSWTLSRIADGKLESIAQNVEDFNAYTQDYAVCLQNRENQKGYDLLVCTGENENQLVAEQVDSLVYPERNQIIVGGVDNSGVTTDIVG